MPKTLGGAAEFGPDDEGGLVARGLIEEALAGPDTSPDRLSRLRDASAALGSTGLGPVLEPPDPEDISQAEFN